MAMERNQKLLRIILLLLALHLLYTNTVLLLTLVSGEAFWLWQALRVLFALSYSLMTVLVIAVYPRWYVYTLSAVLDGFAVWLKYYDFANPQMFTTLASVYFAFYTAFIVVIAGQISRRSTEAEPSAPSDNGQTELASLIAERKSLQRSLARLQDPVRRAEKEKRLAEIERLLGG